MSTWHIVVNWSEQANPARVGAQRQVDFKIQGTKREALTQGVKKLVDEYAGLVSKVESIHIFELAQGDGWEKERAWRKRGR